jgi:lipopolysaccharide export system protein LptC
MTAMTIVGAGRQPWRATRRDDRERAFRRAVRHSRVVKTLRVALPTVTIAGIVLYWLAGWLNPLGVISLPSLANLAVSGTKVTMDLPRLAGYTRDGRAYELSAQAAAQDFKKPQFIELKGIRAKMELRDGNTVSITAATGLYDTKAETIGLDNEVVVTSSDGSEAHLVEARVDIRKGHIVSDKPVEIAMPKGRVNAQQMEIINSGEIVHFRGGVRVTSFASPGPIPSEEATR